MTENAASPLRVLIAGGGVAAIEAGLALRALATNRITLQFLTPGTEFIYRPLEVREPFAGRSAPRYDLAELITGLDADLISGRLESVDAAAKTVRTDGGTDLPYDVLIVALGAQPSAPYPHARAVEPGRLDELLHGFVQDIEGEFIKSAAFIVPDRVGWPLPLYELLFQTAERARSMLAEVALTLVTSEAAPLEQYGADVSAEIQRRLDAAGIAVITSAHAEVPAATVVDATVDGASQRLTVNTVLALSELVGPAIPGLPTDEHGFIEVDPFGGVHETNGVFAAGDATNGELKQGGVAAQHADVVAASVAALAGATVTPHPFRPELRGLLFTGGRPLAIAGPSNVAPDGVFIELETGQLPPSKIAAPRLDRYLTGHAVLPAKP